MMSDFVAKHILAFINLLFDKAPIVAATLAFLFLGAFCPINVKADVVTDWNEIAETAIVSKAKRVPAAALVDMAYVHAVLYDAVNAVDRRYSVYAVSPAAAPLPGTSKEAAGATAAYNVLLAHFPEQENYQYTNCLYVIAEGPAKAEGIALGTEIAEKFLALRKNDGRNAEVAYLPGSGPGAWLPTMPGFTQPLVPWVARMRPFFLAANSQFRAPGPPSLQSRQWRQDYQETKAFGALNSRVRTPEQTEIGRFYTEHAATQCSRAFRQLARERNLSVDDNARLFAMLYLAIADSLIAGWDSKYHFAFWRPVTAIRAGDSDPGSVTAADADWTPLVETPSHPEYPAAHGCVTAALAETLHRFFGTKSLKITLSSDVTKTSRTFYHTDDLIREIIDARVYGGMHYRTSGRDGAEIGRKVVDWMARFQFRPIKKV
jgi:hypothetical protein